MMGPNADPGSASRPEPKVRAATGAAGGILTVVVVVLTALQGSTGFLDGGVPAWLVAVVGAALTVVTALATFVNGFSAPHAPRPDLPESKR